MLAETANARVSIIRGTTTNQYGDIIASTTVAYAHVPVTLVETTSTTSDRSSDVPRTVRQIECLIPAYLSVTTADRLVNEATNDTFTIISILTPPTLVNVPVPVRLVLKRVTAKTA